MTVYHVEERNIQHAPSLKRGLMEKSVALEQVQHPSSLEGQ